MAPLLDGQGRPGVRGERLAFTNKPGLQGPFYLLRDLEQTIHNSEASLTAAGGVRTTNAL